MLNRRRSTGKSVDGDGLLFRSRLRNSARSALVLATFAAFAAFSSFTTLVLLGAEAVVLVRCTSARPVGAVVVAQAFGALVDL